MQQNNGFSFVPSSDGQMTFTTDEICRKLLSHCQHYLNKYIEFLVPPQDSTCEQLKAFIRCRNQEFQFPVDLRFDRHDDDDDDVEACRDSTSPILPQSSRTFKFDEIPETQPIYSPISSFANEAQDEVDSVYRTEPFKFPETTKSVKFKSCLLQGEVQPPLQAFAAAFNVPESPAVFGKQNEKSDVVYLPEPRFEPLKRSALIIPEKTPSPAIKRPKYTTQVSTISQKSNTISLYSCWPPPIGIVLISILEIILYVVNEKRSLDSGKHSHGDVADFLMFDPFRRKEAWRFVTYFLVHIGLQHLLVNLAVQIFLGVILEMVHDRWRVLTIYMAGIVAGSLGTSVFNPRVKLAGASGGVYALITAHIVTVILKWKYVQYPPTQLFVFLIVIITDFASGIRSISMDASENISYVAHGCGALAGVLVGFPILRKLSAEKHVRWFQYVGMIAFLLLISSAVIWNIAATSFFPKQEV